MSLFTDTLRKFPAKDAAKVMGFPLRTVYRWRNGESVPNAWTQEMVIKRLLNILATKARK